MEDAVPDDAVPGEDSGPTLEDRLLREALGLPWSPDFVERTVERLVAALERGGGRGSGPEDSGPRE